MSKIHKTYYFETEDAAQKTLSEAGFAIGTLQSSSPRGLMHGNYYISKWRNLSKSDISNLHGEYQRQYMDGPVTVTIFETCPAEGRGVLERLTSAPSESLAASKRALTWAASSPSATRQTLPGDADV